MLKGKIAILTLIIFSLFISVPINQYVNAQLLPVPGIPTPVNPVLPLDSTSTNLSVNPTTVNTGEQATVTATVSDTTISINTPSGTVAFSDNSAGGMFGTVSCTTSNSMLVCTVIYTAPNTDGAVTITGTYSGDLTHNTSSGEVSLSVITTVPEAPTGLTASDVSISQIDLSWNAPANDGGSAITGYQIERSLDNGATWSILTTTASLTYSDTGLSPSTTYTYRVSAINSIGISTPSNVATATTGAPPTAPQPPTNLSASAVSSSQIDLSWNAPSDGGSAITGYQIERSLDAGITWSIIVSNTGSTSTAYSDTGLSTSTTYTYRVSAINSIGISSPSNVASATTGAPPTAPQPPTNLSATAVSSSQIDLSWNAPSDGGSAITGYQIERSTDDGITWVTIVSNTGSTATTYSDAGLEANTAYHYRVSAINSVGTSTPSNTASATTNIQTSTITVYAHRIPASYWEPCFATECSAGTGPGTTMYFGLYDSSGKLTQSGFVDENGYTFSGLNPNETYFVFPADCDSCHGAFHDVVFDFWEDTQTNERPRATTVGSSLDAWYSCSNNCS